MIRIKNYNNNFENIKIGDVVKKRSGKPFKSGLRLNTVTSICTHKITGKIAFKFLEDDSEVEAHMCIKF